MATPEVIVPLEEPAQDGRDPSGAVGRNLEAFLLFELLGTPSYGYNLLQQMKEYGFGRRLTQPSVVYRVLRSLEAAGAIRSTWTARESGPSRRYYELTEEGQVLLERRVNQLRRLVERGQRLLAAYEGREPLPASLQGASVRSE